MKGELVAFVGTDGSGKTTQATLLADKLRQAGYSVVLLTSTIGVKSVFSGIPDIWERIEVLNETSKSLFWASMYREYSEQAIRYCREGYTVILDRWDESFLAYNLFFGEMRDNPNFVRHLSDLIFQGVRPTKTYFADIDPEICFERLCKRDGENNKENLSDLRLNYEFYRALADERGWTIINADREISEIGEEIESDYLKTGELKIK